MRYVALLRGVNVGGNNKVEMAALRSVFEAAGMESVKTYINSGNVIFTSPEDDQAQLTVTLEEAIAERFGFPVDILLLDAGRATAIAAAIPATWTNDDFQRCDVLYLWQDVDEPAVVDRLGLDPSVEDVLYTPGAAIRRVDRVNAGKSRLTKVVGTHLYRRITIRNCNTARKLQELLEE
jgi:uncharacterized protein (DUF1697 family)